MNVSINIKLLYVIKVFFVHIVDQYVYLTDTYTERTIRYHASRSFCECQSTIFDVILFNNHQ